MGHEPAGDLQIGQVEQLRPVSPADLAGQPGRHRPRRQALGLIGRISLAPGRVDTPDQALGRADMLPEELRHLRLLPGRRRIHREVDEAGIEAARENLGIEQLHRRGADHRRVETPGADELRVHEALVDIHDRPRRLPGMDAHAEGVEHRDEGEEQAGDGQRRRQEPSRPLDPGLRHSGLPLRRQIQQKRDRRGTGGRAASSSHRPAPRHNAKGTAAWPQATEHGREGR